MKNKLIALIICFQIVLSVAVSLFPIVSNSLENEIVSATDDVSVGSNVTEKSIFPESELIWKSYGDYLNEQAETAFNNPEAYIGYEIGFISYWSSAFCRSGFSDDDEVIYPNLSWETESTEGSINPGEVKAVIEDYYFEEDSKWLWYKLKAAEGHTLPKILEEHPYVLYLEGSALLASELEYTPPTFFIGPQKGVFVPGSTTVNFKKQPLADTHEVSVEILNLPAVFDVTTTFANGNDGSVVWDHYDLGDIAAEYTEYRYVDPSAIMLIPPEASMAYEELMAAEDTYEYYNILSEIPKSVQAQFADVHKEQLDVCIESLAALEQVKYETSVDLGGKSLPVSVVGKLPDDVTLQASVVSADTVISEGFDIKDASEIITALDIKLVSNVDGTEWQPKEGRRVSVSIGVSSFGYVDGTVLRMQHKHGENIDEYDIMVVENGALTVSTNGFSIYVVNQVNQTSNTNAIQPNSTMELTVGDEIIFYNPVPNEGTAGGGMWGGTNNNVGTWAVTDTSGAIHYTVHASGTPGHDGIIARWIQINALKATSAENRITLVYNYRDGNNTRSETYTLNIVAPKADAGKKLLYLKDDVNLTGRIVATLVDDKGNELPNGLDGAAFSWSRDDNMFIVPAAYGDNYRSVNIARDHSGLVEARRDEDTEIIKPITYTVEVVLANGEELEAEYTVYYQSEIINADFEWPEATKSNYTFYPNGWPEMYWKTTAPGGDGNISKDIEYANAANGSTNNNNNGTDFGTTENGKSYAASGDQFAELNAEAFGALYQDIITAPDEIIDWGFSHAPRRDQDNWATNISNSMFIVIGATEEAQKLTHDDLVTLGQNAKTVGNGNNDFLTGKSPVIVNYKGADYSVWYHEAGTYDSNVQNTLQWTELVGEYKVPQGQYRTRLFFVSEKKTTSNNANAGNLIDATKGGQYKNYLVEYYVQKYEGEQLVITRDDEYEESGEALVYSSVKLENYYKHFVQQQHDYLHHVEVNGNEYPYDLRYNPSDPENAYLYIERYKGTPVDHLKGTRDYSEYDIVIQLFLRDTVVAVQKKLEFPKSDDDKELLTEEQKLNIMNYLTTAPLNGYQSDFILTSSDEGYTYSESGNTQITQRDPAGNYKAFVALGENPELGHKYIVEEVGNTAIPGLELDSVTFQIQLYEDGKKWNDEPIKSEYKEIKIDATDDQTILLSPEFELVGNRKIADCTVINTYREKQIKVTYEAVGNGKIKLDKPGSVFEDNPTELLDFYSGKSDGCSTHAGAGATFVGWFKDAACTDPVTAVDGVWETNGTFRPNANVIATETMKFYAKFETGSIVINRTGANPGQEFVYHIQSNDNGTIKGVDMYVTLKCDESGNGSVSVLEVPVGNSYTVTECEDWSWRHTGSSSTQTNGDKNLKLVYDFSNPPNDEKWLNGYSPEKKNVFN